MNGLKTKVHGAELVCADSLQFIQTLPENSIDLIATDPPYFGVKDTAWDNQWKSDQEYLEWLDCFLYEFYRVLKPSGSLYMFSGSRLASRIEILTFNHFNVLNHITWAKPSGIWNGSKKESLRRFFPASEKIIFAEHYGQTEKARDNTEYTLKCLNLQKDIFAPLINFFQVQKGSLV